MKHEKDRVQPDAGNHNTTPAIAERFRGYLPVVVDVETGGFDPHVDALLEIAAVTLRLDALGQLHPDQTYGCHVAPFEGAALDPAALKYNGIDPHHPFREAKTERVALQSIFRVIRREVRAAGCRRAILVGHNGAFDLGFINAAVARTGIKRNPFHPFSCLDTVTLGALAFGDTALPRILAAAGIEWNQADAHSASYDAQRTAELFCKVINTWEARARPEDC